MSEAEPDEVVDDAEKDGESDDDDSHEDKVRRVRGKRDAGVALEHVATFAGQVPAQFAVQRFWKRFLTSIDYIKVGNNKAATKTSLEPMSFTNFIIVELL